jgi:hypothetical protein
VPDAKQSNIGEAVRSVMGQFLFAELGTARTLIQITTTFDDSTKKTRCVSLARKAYDAVLQFQPCAARKGMFAVRLRVFFATSPG